MDHQNHVMTLANSIIGVSVLAMPFCFKQCGIVLSILMLLISSAISRLACHFLLKSAIIVRRRTFEFLAFSVYGPLGKFIIEVCIIGFLLGTCIAFFVVIGDLAPEIISEITGTIPTNTLRSSTLIALAAFCILPLALLRNVNSFDGVSKATIAFYCCLALKVIVEAIPQLFNGSWITKVSFWEPAGLLQCLPIFSMALFCQTQLFEIYQTLPNATLDKMNNLVRLAVNICTCVYIFVGMFGYIAFAEKTFTGNILLIFAPSVVTIILKIGFVFSVVFSFPLVVFPCRASLYSLLYKEGHSLHDGTTNYIPEAKFKSLTLLIVFISLVVGIMIPNIEFILGLVGSTIGIVICVLFPVTSFICLSPKNTNERILAQSMLCLGLIVMVLGTYRNLNTFSTESQLVEIVKINEQKNIFKVDTSFSEASQTLKSELKSIYKPSKLIQAVKEVRHEPPQPEEPPADPLKDVPPPVAELEVKPKATTLKIQAVTNKEVDAKVEDQVDKEAIEKEELELKKEENTVNKEKNTNEILLDTIKKHNEVQEEIVKQQKKILEAIEQQDSKNKKMNEMNEEKLKAVKQIETIALKAIERISSNTDKKVDVVKNNKIIEDVQQNTSKIVYKTNEKLNDITVNSSKVLNRLKIPLPIARNLSDTPKNVENVVKSAKEENRPEKSHVNNVNRDILAYDKT